MALPLHPPPPRTGIIRLPETHKLGPAMRKLAPKMQAFVIALLENGDNNYTKAAKMAGYTTADHRDDVTIRNTASRLAHDERVQAAIQEEAKKRIGASVVLAASELVNIAAGSVNEKVKLRAIEMILNRAGLHTKTEVITTANGPANDAATLDRIKALAETLGVDPAKLLGASAYMQPAPKVIEAEYVEETAEYSTEGLEDLL